MEATQHWVLREAWDENYFRPDFLGSKHLIYSIEWNLPYVAAMIDGVSTSPPWGTTTSGPTETLFGRLKEVVRTRKASWIFVSDPDNSLSVLEAASPATPENSGIRKLWMFDTHSVDQGGNQYLALVFEDRSGAVVFTREFARFSGFEIAFYGPEEAWNYLSSALEIAV